MPIFPWSSRGDVPPVGDPAFDALLAGNLRPGDAADGLRPAADAIAALNAAPVTSELAAEASARAMFSAAGRSHQPVRSRRRRRPLVTALLSARLAVAAAGAAVVLGGAGAAAYAGALPATAQKFAHDIIGAPAHRGGHPVRPPAPVGPDTRRQAAYGLCTAYAHLEADGSAAQKAVAFRNLADSAGGAANVTAYCARTAHPGKAASATPPTHSTGRPSAHGTGNASTRRTGKPVTLPDGKPATHPTGKPSTDPAGNPSTHHPGKPATTP